MMVLSDMQPNTYIMNLEIFSLEQRCQSSVLAHHWGTSMELELKVRGHSFGNSAHPQAGGYN